MHTVPNTGSCIAAQLKGPGVCCDSANVRHHMPCQQSLGPCAYNLLFVYRSNQNMLLQLHGL